ISIVANSEEQAKTSFEEIYNTIKRNKTLQKAFEYGKSVITSKKTGSKLKYRTSNGETKDGLRDGAVAFDEIHRYESNKDVKVHISGLGKK
ncbi:terminase large subunit domain-containing protein, partial [Enterococcus faecalis]